MSDELQLAADDFERRADLLSIMGDKYFQERGWKDGMARSCYDGAFNLRTKADRLRKADQARPRHANVLPSEVPDLESWWRAFTKYHDQAKG